MAMPVDFREFTPKDKRNDLMRRLEAAPEQHVEALLALYELLQSMHDKGMVDLARGLLSAGDTVVDKMADLANSAEVTSAMRLMFMMTNLVKALDIDKMHDLLSGERLKPASLVQLGRQAMSEDARLGMTAAVGMLTVFGAALRKQQGNRTEEPNADVLSKFTERFFADQRMTQPGNNE